MTYIDPTKVVSPKALWKLGKVIFNDGKGSWSIAEGKWDGKSVLGIRWNGSDNVAGVGNPQSRGCATWFVLPDELRHVVEAFAVRQAQSEEPVSCHIERPDGYDLGAWRVEAKLNPRIVEQMDGIPLVFSMPMLPQRICHTEMEYRVVVDGALQDKFIDGKWRAHMYSNGIEEAKNPTTISDFRDAFVKSVKQALQRRGLFEFMAT